MNERLDEILAKNLFLGVATSSETCDHDISYQIGFIRQKLFGEKHAAVVYENYSPTHWTQQVYVVDLETGKMHEVAARDLFNNAANQLRRATIADERLTLTYDGAVQEIDIQKRISNSQEQALSWQKAS